MKARPEPGLTVEIALDAALFCYGHVFYGSFWRIGFDGFDALFHARLRSVHLAAADDLLVACQEVEVEFAVSSLFALKVIVVAGVFLYTFYAVFAASFVGIPLAGKDNLAIARLEAEVVLLVILALEDFKFHSGLFCFFDV